tara:strand:- start:42822 stop:43328 length:507 start_codon:yes stop_codon:yes gene_type:complete
LLKPEVTTKAVEDVAIDITNGSSHFSRTELLRRVAEKYQATGVGISAIISAVDHALTESQELVALATQRGEDRYTTKEMLGIERELLNSIERASGARKPLSIHAVNGAISKCTTLSPQQRDAVIHITRTNDRVSCVNGMAGTGKTFMLGVAREAIENAGFKRRSFSCD